MFPFFLCQKFSLSAQIHYKHQWFCYLLKFVQCKWKLKWSERNHFAVLLCFPGTAKQMGSKDRIRGTKTSDERMDVERCCVRVAVPKRGEFNPAGRPNAGFGVLWRNRTRCCKRDMKKLDFFFFLKNLLYRSEGYRGKFKSFKDKDLQGCITSSRPQTDSTKYCVFLYVCDIHSPLSLSPIPPLSTYRRANHSLWSTTYCHHGLSSVIGHRPGSTQKGH